MPEKEYIEQNQNNSILKENEEQLWKAAEEKRIKDGLLTTHTERFRIMMRLMRIDLMLSRAKVTHKKLD